jgi:hypothetical protein
MVVSKPLYVPDEKVLKANPHLKDFMPFLHELRHESERGAVLISCAYLDDLLHKTLAAYFMHPPEAKKLLEGFNAPLGTFSSRTTAAFCCGLITADEFKEINILRTIRNKFAHSMSASFTDQSISDLCANLSFAVPMKTTPAFGLFTTSAVAAIARLTNRHHYAKQSPATPIQLPK